MPELSHVEARGVFKDYGRRRALSNVGVRLLAGQATVLLGENGAGKSTLLSILSTLTRPTRGAVFFGGQPLAALDSQALRAQLGVLSHEPRCYGDLSARENLRFFGRLYHLGSAAEIASRGEQLLERVGLLEAADRPVRTYSRGMLQRLAVGRTLLHRPGLLLLDEPYTGLDRGGVTTLTALLLEERRRGAILLCISHDLEAVAPLCDRAVLLRGGRLVADETYEAGRCTPAALLRLYTDGTNGTDSRRRLVNEPAGAVNEPQGLLNGPQGLLNGPQGLLNGPQGAVKRPAGAVNEPAGAVNEPQGLLNGPQGLLNGPQGAVKEPAGGVKEPAGLLKEAGEAGP